MNVYASLEFDMILERLAAFALSDEAKRRCLSLRPSLREGEVFRRMQETTMAKGIMEQYGTPPLSPMAQLQKVLDLLQIDALLSPEQITQVSAFLTACRRMKSYLKKAEETGSEIAFFGRTLDDLPALGAEIDRCIRNGEVDDKASPLLSDLRRESAILSDQIKTKLNNLLQRNKSWFSEQFVSLRNGRQTLPVRREHKNDVPGAVVDVSQSGGTLFIEPQAIGRLRTELDLLQLETENEVRRILYDLAAQIADNLPALKQNIEAMETLDFLFARGKLSQSMHALPAKVSTDRMIEIHGARHPLLSSDTAVPLDFVLGPDVSGVVITGPNTGGKTVALKTVGLLSLMAQSGLHVPTESESTFSMHSEVLCDIGDGQSILENLSTFSSHMKNVIEILSRATEESLVLLDELGSGTDPAEGMGLAVAVLEELCAKGCHFLATTHYPEVKDYAEKHPRLQNARMAFDRESLRPLYRLELGAAGESCALHIAGRLGMPRHILERAYAAAYGTLEMRPETGVNRQPPPSGVPKLQKQEEKPLAQQPRSLTFRIGDSVMVYPNKEIGIVFAPSNERGEIGVQVKGRKNRIMHKRLKLLVPAEELYPENYDFSIIFDSVENRKARHIMEKRHEPGNRIVLREEGDEEAR